jgi:hypothetical protein
MSYSYELLTEFNMQLLYPIPELDDDLPII